MYRIIFTYRKPDMEINLHLILKWMRAVSYTHLDVYKRQICDLAETVFCDTHAVESVFAKDFFQFFTSFAIEFRICIVVRIIDEWKRNNVETWIKCRVDQVGVHGDLNRVPIHQSLNTFGLVAVCKLVSCINIDFNLSACSFFHQFTELTSAVSPGTCLSSGASEVPGCFQMCIRDSLYTNDTDTLRQMISQAIPQEMCIRDRN